MASDDRSKVRDGPAATPLRDRRRSRRRPLAGAYVALEAPSLEPELCWASTVIDVNGDGMGLVLHSDARPGDEVLVSFRLDRDRAVMRAPAVVLRQEGGFGVGAVRFLPWTEDNRLALVSYLLEN